MIFLVLENQNNVGFNLCLKCIFCLNSNQILSKKHFYPKLCNDKIPSNSYLIDDQLCMEPNSVYLNYPHNYDENLVLLKNCSFGLAKPNSLHSSHTTLTNSKDQTGFQQSQIMTNSYQVNHYNSNLHRSLSNQLKCKNLSNPAHKQSYWPSHQFNDKKSINEHFEAQSIDIGCMNMLNKQKSVSKQIFNLKKPYPNNSNQFNESFIVQSNYATPHVLFDQSMYLKNKNYSSYISNSPSSPKQLFFNQSKCNSNNIFNSKQMDGLNNLTNGKSMIQNHDLSSLTYQNNGLDSLLNSDQSNLHQYPPLINPIQSNGPDEFGSCMVVKFPSGESGFLIYPKNSNLTNESIYSTGSLKSFKPQSDLQSINDDNDDGDDGDNKEILSKSKIPDLMFVDKN